MTVEATTRRWAIAGFSFIALSWLIHTWLLIDSAAFYLPFVFANSDMNTNVKWAETIVAQGVLNPEPYHPYVGWMREVAPYETWVSWWKGAAVFHTAPLFPYLVAASLALFGRLEPVHALSALLMVGLCVSLGWISFRVTGERWGGVAGLWISGTYAPFYGYGFPLLRDAIGWALTAFALAFGIELFEKKSLRWALLLGVSLGLGWWARETFLLIAPASLLFAGWKLRSPKLIAACTLPFVLLVSLLVARNLATNAPPLSVSNRVLENLAIGHARTAAPDHYRVPLETREVLAHAPEGSWAVFVAAVKTHPSLGSWVLLQLKKPLSLFDPRERADNQALPFLAEISAWVKLGLRHWMVIVPGVLGLLLGLLRRDRRHAWLWVVFPLVAASVFVTVPVSRYRQSLMVFWIPWASVAITALIAAVRAKNGKAIASGLGATFAGWAFCLFLGTRPGAPEDRPHEYQMAVRIYSQLGDTERSDQMRQLLRERFPGEPEDPPDR